MDNKADRKASQYPNKPIDLSPDPNTNELISIILDRDKEGMDKFGLTMRQVMLKNPIDCKHWLNNSLQESIDTSRYTIEAIKSYQILHEEWKKQNLKIVKLEKLLKKEKEYSKLLNEHP